LKSATYKYKDNLLYCRNCFSSKIKEEPFEDKPASQEDFDKLLDACLNTPPLRYKDLKEQLKKVRELNRRKRKRKSFVSRQGKQISK